MSTIVNHSQPFCKVRNVYWEAPICTPGQCCRQCHSTHAEHPFAPTLSLWYKGGGSRNGGRRELVGGEKAGGELAWEAMAAF